MKIIDTTTIIFVISIFIGIVGGYLTRKKIAESQIGSASEEARRIIEQAREKGDAEKKELLMDAKTEIHRMRQEQERDTKEKRNEFLRQERRITQREENLDKKLDMLEKRELLLSKKEAQFEESRKQLEAIYEAEKAELERIAGLTHEEAYKILIKEIEDNLQHEKAMKIEEYETQFKNEVENKSRSILSTAIQRCASDYVSETTVSVVTLPNDDLKGRIIGREGRNIRTIEAATGVDLIIDETPEAVVLSSFDPIRREVARVALEKLITDGRIHPARIEDMVEKARQEINERIKEAGEQAIFKVGIRGIHPELIKIIGKLKYRTSYGQNVLSHSIEVANLAGVMASELGADANLAKRAGLLHDIGKALDHEIEGSHMTIGADIAKRYRENKFVVNAIASHHGDEEALTVEAVLVASADAVSAARLGARRENLEIYLKRLQTLENIAKSFSGVEECFAIQAGREIRIMVKPDQINDDQAVILVHDIVKQIEKELDYPGQIKATLIREVRVVDYAK